MSNMISIETTAFLTIIKIAWAQNLNQNSGFPKIPELMQLLLLLRYCSINKWHEGFHLQFHLSPHDRKSKKTSSQLMAGDFTPLQRPVSHLMWTQFFLMYQLQLQNEKVQLHKKNLFSSCFISTIEILARNIYLNGSEAETGSGRSGRTGRSRTISSRTTAY